jgi:hypothetical protein
MNERVCITGKELHQHLQRNSIQREREREPGDPIVFSGPGPFWPGALNAGDPEGSGDVPGGGPAGRPGTHITGQYGTQPDIPSTGNQFLTEQCKCGTLFIPGNNDGNMVPGTHPAVHPDRPFCPGLDVCCEMPPAQVPARGGLEEDSLIAALVALHEFFPFLNLVDRDV